MLKGVISAIFVLKCFALISWSWWIVNPLFILGWFIVPI